MRVRDFLVLGLLSALRAQAQQDCPRPGVWSVALQQCVSPETLAAEPAPLDSPPVAAPIPKTVPRPAPRQWVELSATPLLAQINGRYVTHVGSGGSLQVLLHERFGLVAAGAYHWINEESEFNSRLVDNFRVEAQATIAVLTTWALGAGFEVRPLTGDLSFLRLGDARFSFFVRGLAGAVGRRHQLKPVTVRVDGSTSPATWGETEPRFAMSLGVGLRVELGAHVALRVELQDTFSPTRMETINGCNLDDLRGMDLLIRSGNDPGGAAVTPGCDLTRFTGVVPGTDIRRSNDVPLALSLLRFPSSEWQQNLQVGLGASVSF